MVLSQRAKVLSLRRTASGGNSLRSPDARAGFSLCRESFSRPRGVALGRREGLWSGTDLRGAGSWAKGSGRCSSFRPWLAVAAPAGLSSSTSLPNREAIFTTRASSTRAMAHFATRLHGTTWLVLAGCSVGEAAAASCWRMGVIGASGALMTGRVCAVCRRSLASFSTEEMRSSGEAEVVLFMMMSRTRGVLESEEAGGGLSPSGVDPEISR